MSEFKTIGLIGRLGSGPVIQSLQMLIPFLQEKGCDVILGKAVAEMMPGHGVTDAPLRELGQHCDLVISVGGDGTLLGAGRALAPHNVPVLGVNLGNLGFLTDITTDELSDKIAEVLDGKYTVENRFLIEASVCREERLITEGCALNDVILRPGQTARLIRFDLFVDGEFVYNQRSDGLIVSTPTGSTAYSLAGGGPIMHPKLDALVLVPMLPHTLSSRPIVVGGNAEITIVVDESNDSCPSISCDGQNDIMCSPGDVITIRKKKDELRLMHPLSYNFYETCRSKLGWSTKLGH